MNTLDEVVLQKYKPEHLQWLRAFELPKEQEKFTALPIKMLEITKERHPIVILHNNEPVGFFVLHSSDKVKEYTNNPRAMLLTALSINHSKQGRGFANKGMKKIQSFVTQQFPACNEIILAVNHKNVPAQKLYEKVGFKDTGTRKIGRIGEQYIYNFIIK
ncbi:GNAT family N-acetyltransferase [Peribacillus muralis]|uniref:GNAT family N-acetyltransferase n=1 Tax=Peribacillus muralis TaxID=264697 RepID=A0A1B3XNI4_9BACI|nr:GNAT family N-acetyltransferase [Peribacillus muralis]AOH54779.1 GNAT family N-acetyltransferase [Peribacillus muralis]